MTDESAERERRVLARIPGGAQLLSKRPEQFAPGQWPRHYSKAKGAHTWDLDGRKYVDMSTSGIGTCVLGFADDDVDSAVREVIANGSMSTLNCIEELELAELLCELHPWADMARYARSGGEALAIAVRLARAATGRATVAFCGYHGWHDWYLAANLAGPGSLDGHLLPGLDPGGVPAQLAGTAFGFRYNRLDELAAIAAGNELAAIVMEPTRDHDPEPGFLQGVAELARRTGAVLIFDEVTSGFRVNTGGIHLELGIEPDVAVFAKALGNGYPMAAVLGRASVLEHAQRSFISSTYWTERIGPTAALATLTKHRAHSVGDRLAKAGSMVQQGWRAAASESGLGIAVHGIAPLSHLRITEQAQPSITLFTQLMLDRGFLAGGSFYPSYAHTDEQLKAYLAAVAEIFPLIRAAQEAGAVVDALRGPVAHTGFTRLT
jgi:glutamate-1-semialdehyde 2,1-aminomutase